MTEGPPVCRVPEIQRGRYKKIQEAFQKRHGVDPAFYVRAPGRVNLIGEHIDYCGYAVLPMALEQDIVIAAAPNATKKLVLSNTNSSYSDVEVSTESYTIDSQEPKWHHYFLCGFKGVMEQCNNSDLKGMFLMLDGTVPPSSGLSSSSALVCCSAMAAMHMNDYKLSKLELSDMCMRCERYIGTQGGGMDQSIAFLAQAGTAKLIEFNPIRATDVQLPEGVAFVISNSCVEMNKAATSHFNVRVVECRLACQVLAKNKGLAWRDVKKLGDLQQALGVSLEDMLILVGEVLHEHAYSKQEICDALGVTSEELDKISLSQNTLEVQSFKLYQRASHVFSEAGRVWQFEELCRRRPADIINQLGNLMNDSHASCRDMYECSCQELDDLVDICIRSGAIGSRLTGAGWGGSAVSMVPIGNLDNFIQRVHEGYYKGSPLMEAKVKESLFSTKPGAGAAIYVD